jgi:hypothetical protein
MTQSTAFKEKNNLIIGLADNIQTILFQIAIAFHFQVGNQHFVQQI